MLSFNAPFAPGTLMLRGVFGASGLFLALCGSFPTLATAQEVTPFEASIIETSPELMLFIKAEFPAEYAEILSTIQETRGQRGDLKTAFSARMIELRINYADFVFKAEDAALREVLQHSRHLLEIVQAAEGDEACGKLALSGPSALSSATREMFSEEFSLQPLKVLKAVVSGRKNGVDRAAASESDMNSMYAHLIETQPSSVIEAIVDANPANPELCLGMIALTDSLLRDGQEMERVRANFVYELAIAPVAL